MTPAKSTTTNSSRVRLGELLVKAGVITDPQLKTALAEQKQWGGKLGDILVRLKYLSEDIFVRALSKQLGLARADLNGDIPLDALALVPADVAEEYEVVPVALLDDGKTLAIATADPLNLTVVDYVRSITKLRVIPQVASATAIRASIAKLYQVDRDVHPFQIVNNAEDTAYGQVGGPPPKSGLDLAARPAATTNPGFRAVTAPSQPTVPPPPSYVATSPGATPRPGQIGVPSAAHSLSGMPAYAYPPSAVPMAVTVAPPPLQSYGGGQSYPGQAVEDAQRREAVALKALVELLVQKGVITLDEYLARLKQR